MMRAWRSLSLPTRGVFLFLVLAALPFNLVLPRMGWSPGASSLSYALLYGRGMSGDDSWTPMIKAWHHLHASPEVPVYTELFFEKRVKFQYPPSSLLVLEAIDLISPGGRDVAVLNVLSWLSVLLIIALAVMLYMRSARNAHDPRLLPKPGKDRILFAATLVLLGLLFHPLVKSYVLGQVQTWVTLISSATLLAWLLGRRKTAGVLIGLACTLKPQWIIVLGWSGLRRQWGTLAAGVITAGVLIAVSIHLFGFQHYPDYMKTLSFLSRHGESFYPNQSVNGLVNRILFNGNNLVWSEHRFPPFNTIVYAATIVSSLVLIASALFWRFRSREASGPVELSIVILSATMASPIAWDHHYAIVFPLLALTIPFALVRRPFGRATLLCLALVFILTGQRLSFTNFLAETRLNFLQSLIFLGSLLLLVLLYRVSAIEAGNAPQGSRSDERAPQQGHEER